MGSSPTGSTIIVGGIPKWLKGPVLKTGRSGNWCGGSNPSSSAIYTCSSISRGRAVVARRAHNPEVGSSNLPPATKFIIWSSGVVVNMPPCHGGDRGFESLLDRHFFLKGPVAQLVERRTENPCVAGSIPAWATI